MNTTEAEEERENKRKLEELCEGKSIRSSEDPVFSRKETIDAIRRSDDKLSVTHTERMKRWTSFCKQSRYQSEHNLVE